MAATQKDQGAPGNNHSQSSTRVESNQKVRTAESFSTEELSTREEHKIGSAGTLPATG